MQRSDQSRWSADTTVLAGTSSVTIDLAATTACSPMVRPGRTVAERPSQTWVPRRTGAIRIGRDGSKGWCSESKNGHEVARVDRYRVEAVIGNDGGASVDEDALAEHKGAILAGKWIGIAAL